jgi:hypothetical protein
MTQSAMSIRRVRGSFRDPGSGRRFGNVDISSRCPRHSTWLHRDEEWHLLYGSYTTSCFAPSFPVTHTHARTHTHLVFRCEEDITVSFSNLYYTLEVVGTYRDCVRTENVIYAKLIA